MKKYYIIGNSIFVEKDGDNTYCTKFKKDKISFTFSVDEKTFSLAQEVNEFIYNKIINRKIFK